MPGSGIFRRGIFGVDAVGSCDLYAGNTEMVGCDKVFQGIISDVDAVLRLCGEVLKDFGESFGRWLPELAAKLFCVDDRLKILGYFKSFGF